MTNYKQWTAKKNKLNVMSLLKGLEQIEHLHGRKSHSRKVWKKFRNRWLRKFNKTEIPPTKLRKGWEY